MNMGVRVPPDSTGKVILTHSYLADDGIEYHVQGMQLADRDNPHYRQRVDQHGAAFTRFTEGQPSFDAFGKLRVSQSLTLGDYTHVFDDGSKDFATEIVGTASVTYLRQESGVMLQTGTATGNRVFRTSHKYHRYSAGNSQLIMMTGALGDQGKEGVVRRWGYFDDNDGIFFEQDELTLNVVIRSSTTGTIEERRVPQSQWSRDMVDGTGLSDFTLNTMHNNIYWIDFQWLGAGRVRLGVVSDTGERVTCHEFQNANHFTRPYMKTGSLPLRVEQFNKGPVGTNSEMKFFCATVKTEGEFTPVTEDFATGGSQKALSTTLIPIISIRMKDLLDGNINRTVAIPNKLSLAVPNGTIIQMQQYMNASLVGATWDHNAAPDSGVDVDINATSFTGGRMICSHYLTGVTTAFPLDTHFNYINSEFLHRAWDGGPGDYVTIAAKVVSGADCTAYASVEWKELR